MNKLFYLVLVILILCVPAWASDEKTGERHSCV